MLLSVHLFQFYIFWEMAGVPPPTSGFFGKLLLLTSSMSYGMYLLLGVAGGNRVFSLYNYLCIIKRIFFMEPQPDAGRVACYPLMNVTLVICMVLIIGIGFIPVIYQYVDYIVKMCV